MECELASMAMVNILHNWMISFMSLSCLIIADNGVAVAMTGVTNSPSQRSVRSANSQLSDVSADSWHNKLYSTAETALARLNVLLKRLGVSLLLPCHFSNERRHVVQKTLKKAIDVVFDAFKHASQQFSFVLQPVKPPCDDCQDLLQSFWKRYRELKSKDLKYLMLTCAPLSMPARKVKAEVNCSIHEARSAISLHRSLQFNAFKMPLWISPGHPIADIIKAKDIEFYLKDNNSRPSPNVRDVRRVRMADGTSELKAKRLITMNSSELYQNFCADNPDVQIHYSTFTKLRPVWCKWPGRFGHHNTCTCIIHENFLSRIRAIEYKGRISNFIAPFLCPEPKPDCCLGQCPHCPFLSKMEDLPILTDEIEYDLWRHTDRANYISINQGKESFIEELQEEFPPFVRHHYAMKEQATFIESLKERILTEDSIICYVDFAENYSFNVQNAIQSFHWNNSQATIHPFVVTYKYDGAVNKKAYIVVSDALEHSAVTFHWFRSLFLEELKKEEWFKGVKKIYYVSDGAGGIHIFYLRYLVAMERVRGHGTSGKNGKFVRFDSPT